VWEDSLYFRQQSFRSYESPFGDRLTEVKIMITRILTPFVLLALAASAQVYKADIAKDLGEANASYQKLSVDAKKIDCTDSANAAKITADTDLGDFCQELSNIVNPFVGAQRFSGYIAGQRTQFLQFLASAAESRLDVQNGASASGSGTTSAIVRGGISDVLGLALENGAVTQSVSGSTLTLNGNALSLARFIKGESPFSECDYGSALSPDAISGCGRGAAFLNNLSGSAALNLSNPTTQTVTGAVTGASGATASTPSASALVQNSASHLTSFTVRYQLYSSLDLRSKTYQAAWKTAVQQKDLDDLAGKANTALDAWVGNADSAPIYEAWLLKARKSIQSLVKGGAKPADVAAEVARQWDDLYAQFGQLGITVDGLQAFQNASNAYLQARNVALAKVRQSLANSLSLEYTYSRPPNQPRISTVRLAYTLHPSSSGNSGDSALTFNLAGDLYDSPPPGTGAFKDLQAAIQLDHHFGSVVGSLGAYYQYQNQPAALQIGPGNLAPGTNIVLPSTAATLLAPKGNMIVAQALVTLPLKNGTKLPAGVTWSNRTELIKANEVRGHIGFNFDWSSLILNSQAKK
jgi:hypothetical protein